LLSPPSSLLLAPAPPSLCSLSLHDALPIFPSVEALGQSPAASMTAAAKALLAGLTPEQRSEALVAFDAPVRRDWHNIPKDDRKRSEEHTSELQSRENLVCRLLLEKKRKETH